MPEIGVRISDDEMAKVKRDATDAGLTMPAYIRARLGLAAPRAKGAQPENRNNPRGRGAPKVP